MRTSSLVEQAGLTAKHMSGDNKTGSDSFPFPMLTPEAYMQKIIAALIFMLIGFLATPSHCYAVKHIVVGDHEVTISGEPYGEKVFIPGGVAYDNADGDRTLNIKAQFEIDGGDTLVFFLECLSAGTACPATYRFIFAESDG